MKNKILLGKIKGTNELLFLEDFKWECDWYWSGGYVGNKGLHAHFNSLFLDVPDHRGRIIFGLTPKELSNGCAIWEDLGKFLDDPAFTPREWWGIKDLFKQFYALKAAAEVFQYGGHCTSDARNPKEINLDMAASINRHIENVIIPEIRKATGLNKEIFYKFGE
jgi:hypothetical protein